MITKENFKALLEALGFTKTANIYTKSYGNGKYTIKVDFENSKITYLPFDENFKEGEYPSKDNPSKGFIIHRHTTTNLDSSENFVCLLAVDRLLSKGYEARHIILEPTFKVGHKPQVYGDILVLNQNFKNLVLIENKTYDKEFDKEWQNMLKNGGQLFSYYAVNKTPFLCLLAYDFDFTLNKVIYKSHIITTKDNHDHLKLINDGIEKDKQKLGFEDPQNANAKDYFKVWSETY